MRDIQRHLATLRAQVIDCERLRDAAQDSAKRELFSKMAAHYTVLASELEKALDGPLEISQTLPGTFLGHKSFDPFPKHEQ